MGQPWMHRPELYTGHHWLGGLWMIIVVAMIVVGAVLIARSFAQRGGAGASGPRSEPLRILEERFARGEIDEDDFRKRRELLSG